MLGTAGIRAAIANAIYRATGKRVRRLPIQIENVIGVSGDAAASESPIP